MKKMIAAFDGLKYSLATRDFSIAIAKKTGMHLTGFFMDDPIYNSFSVYDLVVNKKASESTVEKYKQQDDNLRDASALNFETNCKQQTIPYSVHREKNIANQQVIQESMYADLMLIAKDETLTRFPEKLPTNFIRDLLENTQCPVLLLPARYSEINNIMLLYNGHPSSIHAIKMFNYIFPEFTDLPTEIVSVTHDPDAENWPDDRLMTEFIDQHFAQATRILLHGEPKTSIINHVNKKLRGTLVVLGGGRRGNIIRWFRESMAAVLMSETEAIVLFVPA